MISKLKFILPVLLVPAGGAYKLLLSKPAEPAPKPKIPGTVYVLPKDFLVLAEGRYAKLTVALELSHEGQEEEPAEPEGKPPEGFGPMPQEALVRAVVTDALTGASAGRLVSREGRKVLKERVLRAIEAKTDVKAHDVFFPDLTVQ